MRAILAGLAGLCVGATAAPALAQRTNVGADPQVLRQLQREEQRRARHEAPQRLERARQNCESNHGTDCSSAQGLREWLLLERSRTEAVLDRVVPPPVPAPAR